MEDKKIRIISPFSIAVISMLDIAVAFFSVYSVKKLLSDVNIYTIIFVIIVIIAIVVAVLTSKEVLSAGVIFRKNEMEFTALDENNIFEYDKIKSVQTYKDTKASLRKNFVDRYSMIIFEMKNGEKYTVELGMTTTKTLRKIHSEIEKRVTA